MITNISPQIVSYPSNLLSPQMLLVVLTDDGFAWSLWNDGRGFATNPNAWSDWQSWQFDPQNPPQLWPRFSLEAKEKPFPPGWPLLGYIDQDRVVRANGFFPFMDSQGRSVVGQ